jgi:mRNA interferase MazF
MTYKQFEIWLADLNPRAGTEPGKVRPVIVVQTDLLKGHPSTIICPITTNVQSDSEILRIHLKKNQSKLKEDCDIIIDQVRAIDNSRFIKKLGRLPESLQSKLKESLSIVLDLF